MNICFVNENYKMGGVQNVTINIANAMQKNGHNVTLIDFSGENQFFYKVEKGISKPKAIRKRNLIRKLFAKTLKLYSKITKKPISIKYFYNKQIKDLLHNIKQNNYDVIIMSEGTLTSCIPILKKEIPNQKTVAWQHNEYNIYINDYYKEYIRDYKKGIVLADLVICLTEEDQKKFNLLNRNSYYIYNPLTLNNTEKKICNLKSKQIIFVGRLVLKQKGLDYLLKIAQKIKDGWKIVIAGDGPDKKKFLKMINKNKLKDKIVLRGSLKADELKKLYLSGSIFISTSRWEGFGLVITEAMSFGLPIISFNNNGPNEILKNGEYGILVNKNRIDEFIFKLNDLIEDKLKMDFYQKKALERARQFKIQNIIKKWEKILNENLEGTGINDELP